MKNYNIFIATNGCDKNDGSIESPLKTLEAAKKRIRKYRDSGMQVTVNIRGGDYYPDRGILFNCDDGGKSTDTPIIYRAYKKEKVTFFGGRAIPREKISPVTDEKILSRILDKRARRRVLQVDLSDYGDVLVNNFSCHARWHFPNRFYQNGKAMEMARYPKRGGDKNSWGPYVTPMRYESSDRSWKTYLDADTLARMSRWDRGAFDTLWMQGYFVHDWSEADVKISSVNLKKGYVESTQRITYHPKTGPAKNRRLFLYNVLDELSEVGDYYIDYDKKIMYFIPEKSIDKTEIVLPTLDETMFTFDINVRNIRLEGIRTKYTHGKIFMMTDAHNITVENCEFLHGTQVAMQLRRAFNITVRGCHFYDFGCGITDTEFVGERFKLRAGNFLIENCKIHEVAQISHCYTGINIGWESAGVTIRNNEIYDSPHCLIRAFNSSDIIIENNDLHDALRDCDDAGAIYWGMSSSNLGMIIRNNYLHDCGYAGASWGTSALYADGGTGADIYNNIFENVCQGCEEKVEFTAVKCHSESFSHIHNNVFIGGNRIYSLGTWDHQYNFGIAEWIADALGAYTLTSCPEHRQYDNLAAAGFLCDPWREKYKDTIWGKMYDFVSPENVARVQTLKKELKAQGLPDAIVTGRLRLLAADIGWNHKMPDGSIYEGSLWDCIQKEFPDIYNAALADVEGKSEEEKLYRLFRLALEMFWYKHLIPTDCVRVYDNVCVGILDKYITQDGKMNLGYMTAESELVLKDAKIGDTPLISDSKTALNPDAVALIKKTLPDFEGFECGIIK